MIKGVWGTTPFTHSGRFFSTTQTQITLSPGQSTPPPIMIAGGGERVTLRQVAQSADACNLGSFGMVSGSPSNEGLPRKLAALRHAWAAIREHPANPSDRLAHPCGKRGAFEGQTPAVRPFWSAKALLWLLERLCICRNAYPGDCLLSGVGRCRYPILHRADARYRR